ncbi:MAG: HD domain-containing protein [Chloroflexota bacterium]|nr:HD domain-containing protein [Chloroflexota bacterium]
MPRIKVDKQDLVLANKGVEIRLSRDYSQLEEESMRKLRELLEPYSKASRFVETLIADPEVRANWDMADYMAVAKLHFNDHGEVHHKVVATVAASLLKLLLDSDVQPDVVSSGAGDADDAFLAVVAASLLHDIGNQVHREGHMAMSVVLAIPILDRLLADFYPEIEQRIEIRGFILHAIRTHDIDVRPLTMEAAIVAVADACDMTKGRSRYALDMGSISIHTIGGVSIERVVMEKGRRKPIRIRVDMVNSAGIFPVEEYLLPKINAGELAPHCELIVTTEPEQSTTDQRIIYTVEMEGKRFVAKGPEDGET